MRGAGAMEGEASALLLPVLKKELKEANLRKFELQLK